MTRRERNLFRTKPGPDLSVVAQFLLNLVIIAVGTLAVLIALYDYL